MPRGARGRGRGRGRMTEGGWDEGDETEYHGWGREGAEPINGDGVSNLLDLLAKFHSF
jgi:hypothetical protein